MKRLESLDVLRGADLFFLVALGPVVNAIARAADCEWLNSCMWIFHHVEWEGFGPWDIEILHNELGMPFCILK